MQGWCHQCNNQTTGSVNQSTLEVECNNCSSNFFEIEGQCVDEFLRLSQHNSSNGPLPPTTSAAVISPSSSSASGRSERTESQTSTSGGSQSISGGSQSLQPEQTGENVLQQLINRVLGLGVQTSGSTPQSSLLSILQQRAAESGGPVSVVVRQTVSADYMNAISQGLAAGRVSSVQSLSSSSASETPSDRIGRAAATPGLRSSSSQDSRFHSSLSPAMRSALGLQGGSLSRISELLAMLALGADSPQLPGAETDDLRGQDSLESIMHHILMHETSRAGEPPLSKRDIARLKRTPIISDATADECGVCSISQEKFEVGDCALVLPCGHLYKEQLIVEWLSLHGVCPTCRVKVVID